MSVVAIPPTFDGQHTIPSPEVTAIMLELLDLKPEDRLLEIGTGSGMQTREFSKSGCTIHSIELTPFVKLTAYLGGRVYLHAGNGFQGLPHHGPFTAIVCTAGITKIPKDWVNQLSEGGRLVVPLGEVDCQRLVLYKKEQGEMRPQRIGAYVKFSMLEQEKP